MKLPITEAATVSLQQIHNSTASRMTYFVPVEVAERLEARCVELERLLGVAGEALIEAKDMTEICLGMGSPIMPEFVAHKGSPAQKIYSAIEQLRNAKGKP